MVVATGRLWRPVATTIRRYPGKPEVTYPPSGEKSDSEFGTLPAALVREYLRQHDAEGAVITERFVSGSPDEDT